MKMPLKNNKPLFADKRGLTIIEVLVAAFILTIVGFGTLAGLLQARKTTEGSIYLATATTIAQGYIEQMKNMDFNFLDLAVIPELMNQGNDDTLAVSLMPSNPEIGNPATDVANVRGIDINNTPANPNDDLLINFYVYIEDLTDASLGVDQARRIVLRYDYDDTSTGGSINISNTLYSIRSAVPTF